MLRFSVIFLFLPLILSLAQVDDAYLIGTGKSDITGPVAEIHLFGYAEMNQIGNGILQRCYARSYIIVDDTNDFSSHHHHRHHFDHRQKHHEKQQSHMVRPSASRRIVFVNVDLQSMSLTVKARVVQQLQSIFGPDLYTMENVMISSTHTHSAVGGYLEYTLYEIPVKGWLEETVQPIVSGIVNSIIKAHNRIEKGNVTFHSGELLDTNINRSPAAYLLNPPHERELYSSNVDKTMSVLGFHNDNKDLGLVSWFAVHGVSVNKTNRLINGDNKGYASYLVERSKLFSNESVSSSSDPFVAAFAQSNEGDVSPGTLSSFCTGTDLPCDGTRLTKCPWFSTCQGRGPGWSVGHLESNRIIGENQANMVTRLYLEAKGKDRYMLNGPVDYRQAYWNVPETSIVQEDGSIHSLCRPAMGLAFIAGTTDAEPGLGVYQNTTSMPWYWKLIRSLIKSPSASQEACHAPKPILFDTGEMNFPHVWQPSILDLQLLRIGNVFIAGVPAEFTTMSGRRLRNAIKDVIVEHGVGNTSSTQVILSGPANGYSSYVSTFEEYQMQRFEGAATAYGPHTLEGYIKMFQALALSMVTGQHITTPRSIKGTALSNVFDVDSMTVKGNRLSFDFTPRRRADHAIPSFQFGDVINDVSSRLYQPTGNEVTVISVSFVAGNPRNNLMLDNTYLTVEQKMEDGTWKVIRNDHDYDTRFRWIRKSWLFGQSEAVIEWAINNSTDDGTFRIGYFGHNKGFFSRMVVPHHGYSTEFRIKK